MRTSRTVNGWTRGNGGAVGHAYNVKLFTGGIMETLLVIGAVAVVLGWVARSDRSRRERYPCERLKQRIKDWWAWWRALQ